MSNPVTEVENFYNNYPPEIRERLVRSVVAEAAALNGAFARKFRRLRKTLLNNPNESKRFDFRMGEIQEKQHAARINENEKILVHAERLRILSSTNLFELETV